MSLQDRRIRGDMIQTWKYLDGQNPESGFGMAADQHSRSSRHTTKPWNIARADARLKIRKNFFTSRCVERWNSLSHSVQNVDEFKAEYD